MTATPSSNSVVAASLEALLAPPAKGGATAPREILEAVSGAWADDGSAWRLARRLASEADRFLQELERQRRDRPGDTELERLRGRARYAQIVAITLSRDLRIPARQAERSAAGA